MQALWKAGAKPNLLYPAYQWKLECDLPAVRGLPLLQAAKDNADAGRAKAEDKFHALARKYKSEQQRLRDIERIMHQVRRMACAACQIGPICCSVMQPS